MLIWITCAAESRVGVMNIGIDCRLASIGTGLGRYTRELVTHLVQQKPSDVEFVLFTLSNANSWLKNLQRTTYNLQPTTYKHYSLSEQLFFPRTLKNSGIDLLFSPHFNVPMYCPVPFVCTIHDLILHRYPNKAGTLKRLCYKQVMNRAINKAQQIIAVSTFTGLEIEDIYGTATHAKTTVIGEAPSPYIQRVNTEKQNIIMNKYCIHKPFFLYVGNAKEHKNLPLLLQAFKKANVSELLVLVSSGKEAEKLRLPPNTIRIEGVNDDDLSALYSAAQCFVSPSLYEGFGLPLIEAQICGCPVIACNRSAIPQTAGNEALIIEPTVDAFIKALKNPPSPPQHFRTQTWQDVAKETIEVLRNVTCNM